MFHAVYFLKAVVFHEKHLEKRSRKSAIFADNVRDLLCFNDIIKITSRQEGLQMQFSNDFLWGAASASYQIEGAYLEDGKGENIWDAYCQESGHVAHGENGNVACDHYHRFRKMSR